MRKMSWRVLIAAAAGFALIGAGTSTAQAAEHHGAFSKGDTRVVVAPEVYALVAGAGITPSAIKPATAAPTGKTIAARFPISSINVSKVQIKHTGGIKLAAGSAKISLRNFVVDVNRLRVYGAVSGSKANVKKAPLFNLEGSTSRYGSLKLTLTKTSASALNATFGVDAFQQGATFGYAKVRPKG